MYIALTPAAEQPIGYLVEHMRVGAGDTLEIEYREGNFSVFTENYQCVTQATATKRTRARDAGVMVITRYSRQQAKDFLEEFLLPGLDKFVTVYDKLAAQPDVKEAYRRCANRDIFYNQQ